jgi:hypothetical protein
MISDHQSLVTQAAQTDSDAFTLLALQSRVATDPRAVLSRALPTAVVLVADLSQSWLAQRSHRRISWAEPWWGSGIQLCSNAGETPSAELAAT